MDFSSFIDLFTLDNLSKLISEYRELGPIPGILLPFFEAFFPFLPLFVFVTANANAFGLWIGFILSWVGATSGAMMVFYLARIYGKKRALGFVHKHPAVQKAMLWIDRHGFGPLFLLLCFPFTPSALVNIVGGLSDISPKQYMLAVLSGKMVMIFTISFINKINLPKMRGFIILYTNICSYFHIRKDAISHDTHPLRGPQYNGKGNLSANGSYCIGERYPGSKSISI